MNYFLILLLFAGAALIFYIIRQSKLKRLSAADNDRVEQIQAEPMQKLLSHAGKDRDASDRQLELPIQAAPPKSGDMPPRILIVDDQAAIRMLLCEMFELEGLQVCEASNGRMAIELVRQIPIDFILMDVKMPDMDGFETLTEIRSFNSTVKVAMITAYGDSDKLELAKQLGTLAFFTKPFDIEIVKSLVLSSLRSS
ncbi:Protein-glutamate methylesterase/protein-glutamine glutaminase [Paenibacillus plantiphilus]|uniref:Protein-glutamate methylesterase/protein-glutamine glutaminase n=1 Tax=Paenibacillus plantiphilus TaxID=2905650 RepID=A0ABM9C4T5_9BACL|nr:response regulator [Paenibacillus plantiphilus]CAH1203383.1 Protein-glutamate methylesterase/protein-glutamine glutaminase [Paenibacillus plantiphilus]